MRTHPEGPFGADFNRGSAHGAGVDEKFDGFGLLQVLLQFVHRQVAEFADVRAREHHRCDRRGRAVDREIAMNPLMLNRRQRRQYSLLCALVWSMCSRKSRSAGTSELRISLLMASKDRQRQRSWSNSTVARARRAGRDGYRKVHFRLKPN
jgi:hypothetical protein